MNKLSLMALLAAFVSVTMASALAKMLGLVPASADAQNCEVQSDNEVRWDDRLDAIPPLAGSLLAWIGMLIVLTAGAGDQTAAPLDRMRGYYRKLSAQVVSSWR